MSFKDTWNIITTLLLAGVPVTLIFGQQIQAIVNIPPTYVIVVTLVLAALSQLATNSLVKDAEERLKKYVWFDYLTTIFFALVPIVLAYQEQILAQVPIEIKLFVVAGFGVLSHFAGAVRVDNSTEVIEDNKDEETVESITTEPTVEEAEDTSKNEV